MARLRRNKERPPQTVHVQITEDSHIFIASYKKEKDEPFYKVLDRTLARIAELELVNNDLKESLKDSREIRRRLEERINDLESKEYEKSRPLPRFTN